MTDFGKAAPDYARHRKGFPESFFTRLRALGIAGSVLDLGTGTASIARHLGGVGFDRSIAMLREAPDIRRIAGRAEFLPFRSRSFDVITAGQAWIWFDGPLAAREAFRVLRPSGRIVVAHFDYLPAEGNVAEETEQLILRYNPTWRWAGSQLGVVRDQRIREHVQEAGFVDADFWEYEEPVEYSHEGWRGRIRACNGVIDLATAERVAAFDADLAQILRRFPDPVVCPHRISALTARAPTTGFP